MTVVTDSLDPVQPMMMTIGDEFQGLFEDVEGAIEASFRIRVRLLDTARVRIGIGWGGLELVSGTPPFGQDGPCWWLAREAIGAVKKSESSNAVPRNIRTMARTDDEREPLLNAYLVVRDQILSEWDVTDARIAALLVEGASQTEIADAVGLSQSSVSRRLQRHGIFSVIQYRPGRLR